MSQQGQMLSEDRVDLSKAESREVRRRSLRLLGDLIRPVRGRFILTVVLVLLSQAARAAGPLIIAYGIDRALPAIQAGDPWQLVFTGLSYTAIAALEAGLTAGYITNTARMSQAILLDLRLWVFRHSQRLSLEFHENYTSGRIISRQTSDLEALRELLDSGVSALAQGLVYMALTLVSIFVLDWPTGFVVLIALIPVLALLRWYRQRSQVAFRDNRVRSARLIVNFVETMTGIRAVKTFRREKANDRHYQQLADEYQQSTVTTINLVGVLQPGLLLIGNTTVAVVLLVGGTRVLSGVLSVGALLALLLATKRFFQPLDQMAMFYMSFQSAQSALEKVSGLLAEEPTVQEARNPVSLSDARGEVDFRGVDFRYGDGPLVMENVNLHIPAGQTVAVVGETGAGKSTLAKLLSRFYDVSSGDLSLDGISIQNISSKDLRKAVVMVTQEAFLFSGTIAENIALGNPEASKEQIIAAATLVGADEFIQELPDGYDTDVNKRGGRLSAGQRQLVSFARAVVAEPAVLILDEATASLDLPSERQVQAGLQRLLDQKRTAIIIAHRLSTVEIADRVLVVDHGQILEDGSPDELLAAGGRFAELHQAWQDSLA